MKMQVIALAALSALIIVHNINATFTPGAKHCYCAVKCGPRDVGSVPGDAPFLATVGGQTICFCQQLDFDLYSLGACRHDSKATMIPESACG